MIDGAAPRSARWLRQLRLPGALFLVTLGLAVVMCHAALAHPTTSWKGDPGDPEQLQVFLAWTPFALGHGLNPFVTHYLLYPGGANLMWNTSVFLPGLLVSPVTVLFGPTVAYDVLTVLAMPVAAVAGYAAFRRWVGPAGAAVGGFLFAICPFLVAHVSGHLHLMLLALVPLTLAMVDEVFVRQRWRPWVAGAGLGAVAAAQLLTAEEVLALDVVLAVIALVVLAAVHPRGVVRRLRHAAIACAVALGVFAVLAGYPLYVQFLGPDRVVHSIHLTDFYVNDLAGIVTPVNQLIGFAAGRAAAHSWTGNSAEWNGYIGIPLLLVIAALLVWRRRRALVWTATGFVALTLLFSLGSRAHLDGRPIGPTLPWGWLGKAPVLHQVLPARFGLYADLFAALLAAVFVDELWRTRRPAAAFFGGLAVGAVVMSWLPHGWPTTTVEQPAYFRAGHGVERIPAGSVAVVLPFVDGPNHEHTELWQARAGFRFAIPEGYLIVPGAHTGPPTMTYLVFSSGGPSGDGGRGYGAGLTAWEASVVRDEWRRWGVTTVVVGPGSYDEQRVAQAVATVVRAPPTWQDGVAVFSDVRSSLAAAGGG